MNYILVRKSWKMAAKSFVVSIPPSSLKNNKQHHLPSLGFLFIRLNDITEFNL